MRRADRLFQIVQMLRCGHVTTAAHIATELEVSERTVYRDVQDLVLSGVPIQGEAGVGYALPAHFELPPLMFDAEEIAALALGARMVEGWADRELARAARSALRKIEHVLPKHLAGKLAGSKLFVPDFHIGKAALAAMQVVREALDERRVLQLRYADEGGASSERCVRPLGLYYWGKSWTLVAWCELRRDFRSFRVDRIDAASRTESVFVDEPGKTLEDFLQKMRGEREAQCPTTVTAAAAQPMPKRQGPPIDKVERAAWKEFQQLGSIGPASAHDLVQLGFRSIAGLRGQDPHQLYARLCELTRCRQDPCVEDVLRCAVAQAENPSLPEKWQQWFHWTPLRGTPAGTLPKALQKRSKR